MDGGGGFAEHYDVAFNGEEVQEEQYDEEQYGEEQTQQLSSGRGIESYGNVDGSAGNDLGHRHRDSSSGKLFIGGVSWDTSQEKFTNYFLKYGEITDSVIMVDKLTGRSRGFGFVTFADPAIADRVMEQEHVIDGRAVEVKRTVPREEMQGQVVQKTRKIFVGGIPTFFTEDELKEYFSSYGIVVEHQIMIDRNTGRSRGFGFVTFENEDTVGRIFSDRKTHELGGKQVEIKKAVPRRADDDYTNDVRPRHSESSSKLLGGFGRGAADYGGGGKMSRQSVGYGGYGSYGGGNYGGATSYGGYGGYGYGGFGFWGPYDSNTGYGGGGYGTSGDYGGDIRYGSGKGYKGGGDAGYGGGGGRGYGGGGGYGGGRGYGGGGDGYGGGRGYGGGAGYVGGGGKGYDSGAGYGGGSGGKGYDDVDRGFGGVGNRGYGNGSGASRRFHPYQK